MSHSPAPWNYRPCRCGHPNCNQYTISTQGSVGFDEDDARLIVAAPDLLDALEEMLFNCYDHERDDGIIQAVAKAHAAIAKATGEKA